MQTSTSLTPITADQDLRDDVIVVTPRVGFPNTALTVEAQPAAVNQISVSLCNQTAAPVNVGSRTFSYVTLDTGGQ